jgi:hypothetical protein
MELRPGKHLQSQLLGRLRQENFLSPEVPSQPGQYIKILFPSSPPTHQKKKKEKKKVWNCNNILAHGIVTETTGIKNKQIKTGAGVSCL